MSSPLRTGIGAVILAAGGARRFGGPKLLVRDGDGSLLGRTVIAARGAGCDPVIVVVGAHADRILPELAALHAAYVMNGEWRRGIGGSIACGAQEIQRRRASLSGIMLIVADLPRLDAQVLERLVAAFDATPGCRVASAYADTVGVPAIFGRSYFGPLTELAADRGAQPLLLAGREHVIAVAWPEGARDVDVRADAPDAT